jgi:hypothetical protein
MVEFSATGTRRFHRPGVVFYILILTATSPVFFPTQWIAPSPSWLIEWLYRSWIGLWIGALPIVFITMLGSIGLEFPVHCARSRSELEILAARMSADANYAVPQQVGHLQIGKVKRLPNGVIEIPTYVGYHWLDAQGLIYSSTPPARPENRSQKHLTGNWYIYNDG